MKSKKILAEAYIRNIYKEGVKDPMYAPEVAQSRIDFRAGFNAKEKQIKERIESLEGSKGFRMEGLRPPTIKFNNQQEQMEYAKRVDEVIKILKLLLDEN